MKQEKEGISNLIWHCSVGRRLDQKDLSVAYKKCVFKEMIEVSGPTLEWFWHMYIYKAAKYGTNCHRMKENAFLSSQLT